MKFDVVGDVHGCGIELKELLDRLQFGYYDGDPEMVKFPDGRKLVFVGDLTDRGPDSAGVLELVMNLHAAGVAHVVMGNHDWKLLRVLRSDANKEEFRGNVGRELKKTLDQIFDRGPEFTKKVYRFLDSLPTCFETSDLIVVHGAYDVTKFGKERRDFNLFGETSGSKDEDGYPKRLTAWKSRHSDMRTIVTGHDPLHSLSKRNEHFKFVTESGAKIYNVDWGVPFGGELAAYQYPEDKIVSVPAKKIYYVPKNYKDKS